MPQICAYIYLGISGVSENKMAPVFAIDSSSNPIINKSMLTAVCNVIRDNEWLKFRHCGGVITAKKFV
jgi:hypothetical protein